MYNFTNTSKHIYSDLIHTTELNKQATNKNTKITCDCLIRGVGLILHITLSTEQGNPFRVLRYRPSYSMEYPA